MCNTSDQGPEGHFDWRLPILMPAPWLIPIISAMPKTWMLWWMEYGPCSPELPLSVRFRIMPSFCLLYQAVLLATEEIDSVRLTCAVLFGQLRLQFFAMASLSLSRWYAKWLMTNLNFHYCSWYMSLWCQYGPKCGRRWASSCNERPQFASHRWWDNAPSDQCQFVDSNSNDWRIWSTDGARR